MNLFFLIFFNCVLFIGSAGAALRLINDLTIKAVEQKFKAKSFEIAGIDVSQNKRLISFQAGEAKELFFCDETKMKENIKNFFRDNALVLSSVITSRLIKKDTNASGDSACVVDSIPVLEKNSFFGYTVYRHARPEDVFSAAFNYAVLKKFSSKSENRFLNEICKNLCDEKQKTVNAITQNLSFSRAALFFSLAGLYFSIRLLLQRANAKSFPLCFNVCRNFIAVGYERGLFSQKS
jgi:hypothetical protein